jgi:DUF971 family protein
VQLTRDNHLQIEWSDGQRREYTPRQLRDCCPCADCRQTADQPAPGPESPPTERLPLKITAMKPVGHYAYAISFSDGHNLGMYTLEQLRVLGREVWGVGSRE